MSAGWKTDNGLEKYLPEGAEYHDTVYTNPYNETKWVPDSVVEGVQVCDGVATFVHDPRHGDRPHSHEDKRDHIFEQYFTAPNEVKAGESKSSRGFNQAFIDATATMRNSSTGLHPRNPQRPHPSTPDLPNMEPPKSKFKVKNVIQQTPKHNDSSESIKSWGTND